MEQGLRQKRRRQFDHQMGRCVAQELLLPRGFEAVEDRTFLRPVQHEDTTTTQIIAFQVGTRSLAGRFTVNLAVYNPALQPPDWPRPTNEDPLGTPHCYHDLTKRLGFFVKPHQSSLSRLLKRKPPAPKDHWWEQSPDESRMREIMEEVRGYLEFDGLPWLDRHTCRAAFTWAAEELARRKRWIESHGAITYEPSVFGSVTDAERAPSAPLSRET